MPSWDAAVDDYANEPTKKQAQLDASLSATKDTSPDDYANTVKLGREAGVSPNVVQLNPKAFEERAKVERVKSSVKWDSITADFLSDPNNAKIAHDDVENLSLTESALKGLRMAGHYTGEVARSVVSGVPSLSAGLWGAFAAPFDLVGLDSVGGKFRQYQRDANQTALNIQGLSPDAGPNESALMSGFQSAGQNLALLPLGLANATRDLGTKVMLGVMGTTTGGQSYGKGIEAGITPAQAAAYGIEDATAEVVTEHFLGAEGLLTGIKAGASAAKLFMYEVSKEVPGEIGATLWQNFNEWMNVNPDKSVADFVNEQPAAVGQTIIATLVGGGTQIGTVKALEKAASMTRKGGEQAQAGDQQSRVIEQINKLAQASKVAERDVDTFEGFLQRATEDGPVPDLYIDAETFKQSGVADQVMEVAPSVREQYQTALSTGGTIRIPTAEYGARIATLPELSGPLLDHLKTDPMGFSASEAKTYQKEQGPALEAEIGRALEQSQGNDAFNASRDAVKQSMLDQLNAVGRNTPAVNEAYASIFAARTAVRAGQLGITPEEMAQKQLLRVQGESVAGQGLSQGLQYPTAPRDEWWGEGTYKADGGKIVYVTPDEYLAKVKPLNIDEADSRENIDILKEHIKSGKTLDPLLIRKSGKEDGRHRAYAAKELGIEKVPVIDYGNHFPDAPETLAQSALAPTITIDGKERHTTNSNGQPIAQSEEAIRKFYAWFKDSKVVDDQGRPLVVYHGTNQVLDKFSKKRRGKNTNSISSKVGFFFTEDTREAAEYANLSARKQVSNGPEMEKRSRKLLKDIERAESRGDFDTAERLYIELEQNESEAISGAEIGANVLPVYLNISSPRTVDFDGSVDLAAMANDVSEAKKAGNDGLKMLNVFDAVAERAEQFNTTQWVALEPNQVKSAIGNSGQFSPTDANILKQSSYHGSPYRFNKFDLSKIGTGEGAQAYGWGQYFADAKDVAESYRIKNRNDTNLQRIRQSIGFYESALEQQETARQEAINDPVDSRFYESHLKSGFDERISDIRLKIESLNAELKDAAGQLYAVDIPDEAVAKMLDWDKPTSEQPALSEKLKKVLPAWGKMEANLAAGMKPGEAARAAGLNPIYGHAPTGGTFYNALADRVGQKEASKILLKEAGIPGLRYLDQGSRNAKDGTHNTVIWDQKLLDQMSENLQTFYQGNADRGGFSPSQNIITLLKNADLSTFEHELAHYFFENDIALANELIAKPERTVGEQQIVDDVSALLKWHGLEGDVNEQLDQWNQMDFEQRRVHHERTAESFEKYLFDGKAPSIELSHYFQKFREFMLQVYKSLKQFLAGHPEAGKLNDEVRGVFDRMLATDEQIALAEQARSMLPLFKTAEEASKFGVDFEAYQVLAKGSTQAAVETLQAQGLKDMQWLHNAHGREVTKLKKQSDALRREIRQQVRTEVMQRPVYQAWTFLTNRMKAEDKIVKPPKPDTGIEEANRLELENYQAGQGLNLEALTAGRLDAAEVAAMDLPPETVKRLEDFKMTSKTGGLHPDLVADMFGLSSGDDLVRSLYDVPPPQQAIEEATDARMLSEHGELATPEAIAKAADKALYNAARGKMLVADANALANATAVQQKSGKRTINILPAAAKEAAANLISRVVIRNLRPAQYEAAEIKAGKATEKAKNAGKLEEAAAQARTRLFNHYAVMEAYRAQEEVADGVRYLKKVQTPGKIPADHFDQITSILDKFDLRQATNKKLDNAAMFQTWARAQLEAGNVPPNIELLLTPAQRAQFTREVSATNADGQLIYGDEEKQAELLAGMLDQTPVRNYRQLTIEEFRGLVDTIKQIEHIGRRTKRVLTDRKKREFNAVVDEIKANIVAVATEKGRKSTDVRTPTDSTLKKLLSWRGFWGSHIKAATSLNIMDGRDFGPLWEHLVQTANEAGNGEVLDGAEAYKAVDTLLKPVKAQGNITDKAKFFPTINESLNRQERIVMALNLGNESNEQRLLGGKSWTRDQIQPVLDTLIASDWKFVQGMWDLFESYRPRVAAMERDINGVEPEWIEARPLQVKTADGETLKLRGGYAPVIFDPRASGKAASFAAENDAKAMMQAARVASTVNKSFTKARVTEVKGRPLLLSLDAMIGGIQDTIHYLHWQPWIIDANRLVKALDAPMREHYGAETVSQLRNWVGDNAAGTRPARDGAERAITNMARNVSFAGLAFNVFSAAQQITGYSQSVSVVGAKWMGKGVAKTLQNPRAAFTEAAEKSSFMRKRGITRMRDLAETHTVVRDQGKIRTALDETGYAMILAMQSAVDTPTWWAGYEKALDAGVSEEEAIHRADQGVIDSQGSGMSKDLASVERATGAIRLMTGFMSFMNTTLNINYRIAKSGRSVGEKAVDFVLVNAIPVILSMLIKGALTPDGDDEDKTASEYAKKYAAEQFSFMMGQMIGFREIGQAGAGILGLPTFGYQGSTGARIYADTLTLAQQIGQGEMDDALRKAIVNTAADFLRLPSAQINRTITGTEALLSDETDNPAAVVFGYRK